MKKRKKGTPITPQQEQDLKKTIKTFKDDVNELRDDIWYESDQYTDVKGDEYYRKLEEESDLTRGDIDLELRANVFQRYFEEEHESKKLRLPEVIPPEAIKGEDVPEHEVAMFLEDDVLGETDPGTLELGSDKEKIYPEIEGNALAARRKPKPEPSYREQLQKIFDDVQTDLSFILSERLTAVVGLFALLIGVILLVRYGIQEGHINEKGQILISLATSAGFFILSHFYRKTNKSISGLASGFGIFVAYLSGYLYFDFILHEDGEVHLGEQFIAFFINIIITTIAVIQALSYGRRTIAAFGMLGGYIMPWFVSVNETNDYLFFGYLLMINIGFLVISFYRRWSTLNLMTFSASLLIFGKWVLGTDMNISNYAFVAHLFGMLYYLTFLVMNIAHSLRKKEGLDTTNYILVIINTIFYAVTTLKVLFQTDADAAIFSIFSLTLTVFNYAYAYILYRNNVKDLRLLNTVIILSVVSATVSIPLFFEGRDTHLLMTVWVIEAVALTYIGLFVKLNVVKSLSVFVFILSLVAMGFQWISSYTHFSVRFFFNRAVMTAAVQLLGMFLMWIVLLRRPPREPFSLFRADVYRDVLVVLFFATLFFIVNLELLGHGEYNYNGSNNLRNILVNLWHLVFVGILWTTRKYLGLPNIERTVLAVFGLVILSYFGLVVYAIDDVRYQYVKGLGLAARNLMRPDPNALQNFMLHYINLVAIISGLILACRVAFKNSGKKSVNFEILIYLTAFIVFVQISIEYYEVFKMVLGNSTLSPEAQDSRFRFGQIVTWLMMGLLYFALGFRLNLQQLRFASLAALFFTLIKFLAYDFWQMGQVGRILSLLTIAGIFLLVSFLASQLSKIIVSDLQEAFRRSRGEEEIEEGEEER
ncbi:MAG: DUF2339 domain-containing protein [Bacteroidota bacterium]